MRAWCADFAFWGGGRVGISVHFVTEQIKICIVDSLTEVQSKERYVRNSPMNQDGECRNAPPHFKKRLSLRRRRRLKQGARLSLQAPSQ